MRSKLLFFEKSSLQHIAWLPMFGLVPFTTNGQVCLSTEDVQATQIVQRTSAGQSNNQIEINAGHIDLSSEEGVQFSGEVEFRYGDRSIVAKSAYFDRADQHMEVIGTATYSDPNLTVFGEGAEVDTENEEILFRVAGFEIPDETARGSANEIKIRGDRTVSLLSVNFTTCPVDKEDWEFLASELDLNANAGFGTARDVKLRFKGLPILYAPYITFPIDDQRKSGFLTPHFGQSDRTGLDLEIPYYLNLSPNYDMTLKPRYLSKRGLQLNTEFRYLRPRSGGQLNLEYLPDDDKLNRARRYFNLNHESSFGSSWHLITSIQNVSDNSYFEDLGSSLSVTSQTHLDRYLQIAYQTPRWSLLTRIQSYQTIDPRIESSERPYERIPQLLFDGDWSGNRLGIRVTSELVNFDRDLGTTGWRFDSNQELSFSVNKAGMFLTPAIALRQTNYWLNDAISDGQDSISRTLPIASLDAGLTLERSANKLGNWIQTLEPRVLYVHIPYKNQALLPVFDTIDPDFNLVQLFRKYQFLGPDRVADADKISFGITTRLIDQKNGQEKLTATLGQTRYRSTEGVVLPGSLPSISDESDYIAEISVNIYKAWNLGIDYQWNSYTNAAVRKEVRFQYRPNERRLFSFGYRYRRDLLEQGDMSLVWPMGDSWRVIGRYNYSLLEKKPLEKFLGLEYESCCWRARLVGRRFVSRRTGESDSSISLQLQLKGFSDEFTTPEELLDRGILGYQGFGGGL